LSTQRRRRVTERARRRKQRLGAGSRCGDPSGLIDERPAHQTAAWPLTPRELRCPRGSEALDKRPVHREADQGDIPEGVRVPSSCMAATRRSGFAVADAEVCVPIGPESEPEHGPRVMTWRPVAHLDPRRTLLEKPEWRAIPEHQSHAQLVRGNLHDRC